MDNLVQLLDGLSFTADDALKAVQKAAGQIPQLKAPGLTLATTPPAPPAPAASTDFVAETLATLSRPVLLWQILYLAAAGAVLWQIFVKRQRRRGGAALGAFHKSHRRRG